MRKIFAVTILLVLFASGCRNSSGTRESAEPVKKIDARQFFKDSVERVEKLCLECTPDAEMLYVNYIFTDIDGDGVEEMYLKENESGKTWLFCCGGGYVELIANEDEEHFVLSNLVNIVRMDGHFPSGYTVIRYFELDNSHVTGPDFMESGEMNLETGEPDLHFCPALEPDGTYPEEKTRPFFAKLDKLLESNGWTQFKNEFEGFRYTPLGFLNGKIGEEPDPSEMEDTVEE